MVKPASPIDVYQLRVVLRGISPLIWRGLLLRGDATLADLHDVLQIAFGWEDYHLHRFSFDRRQLNSELRRLAQGHPEGSDEIQDPVAE